MARKNGRYLPATIPYLQMVVLLYVFVVPFDIVATPIGRTPTSIVSIAVIPVWFMDRSITGGKLLLPGRLIVPLLLGVTWTAVTLLWGDPAYGGVIAWLQLFLAAVILTILIDVIPRSPFHFLTALSLGGIPLSVLLLSGVADLQFGRSSVGDADENLTAYVLSGCLAATLLSFYRARGRAAVMWVAIALLTAAAILVTGSRTGLVALFGIIVISSVLAVAVRSKEFSSYRAPLIVIAVAVAYPLVVAWQRLPLRLMPFFQGNIEFDNSAREWIHGMYYDKFSEWYLFGIGYGNDAAYLQSTSGHFRSVHNTPLSVWVEAGIPGIFLAALFAIGVAYFVVLGGLRSPLMVALVPVLVFGYTLGGLETVALTGVLLVLAMSPGLTSHENAAPRTTGN